MLRLAHGKASALDLELLSALEQALADVAASAARAALGAYVERTLGGRRSPEARRGANHAAS